MKTFFRVFAKWLFAPFVWFIQSCSPIGPAVNPELSDNHYYNKAKTDVHYVPMGNWFELGNTEMNVDVGSFQVLTELISKDKEKLYYFSSPVVEHSIDLASFYTKTNPFMTDLGFDKDHVYVFSNVYEEVCKAEIIQGANAESFIRTDIDWANDGKNHFYQNRKIDVDFDSFERINTYFSKDRQHIYHHHSVTFELTHADLDSFEILSENYFARDKSTLYISLFHSSEEGATLEQVKIGEGEELKLLSGVYLKIGDRFYYYNTQIEGLDAESVELVGSYYLKDKEHVYYMGKKLEGVDAATLAIQENKTIADKYGILIAGERKRIETESN